MSRWTGKKSHHHSVHRYEVNCGIFIRSFFPCLGDKPNKEKHALRAWVSSRRSRLLACGRFTMRQLRPFSHSDILLNIGDAGSAHTVGLSTQQAQNSAAALQICCASFRLCYLKFSGVFSQTDWRPFLLVHIYFCVVHSSCPFFYSRASARLLPNNVSCLTTGRAWIPSCTIVARPLHGRPIFADLVSIFDIIFVYSSSSSFAASTCARSPLSSPSMLRSTGEHQSSNTFLAELLVAVKLIVISPPSALPSFVRVPG